VAVASLREQQTSGEKSVVSLTCIKVKVKVKFTLEQATKAQKGIIGIALLFL
jgi:hypothetical protein